MVGQSRESPGGPDAFACGAVPEVHTLLRASSLKPDLVMGGIPLASSRQNPKDSLEPQEGKNERKFTCVMD